MLERGAYHEAALKAVSQLQRNSSNEKAQQVLRDAYPLAVAFYTDEITRVQQTDTPFAASITADAYGALNELYKAIQQSPVAQRIVPQAKAYYREQGQAASSAAAEQYRTGEALLATRRREAARQAYAHFLRADAYVPDYQDVAQRLAEAREAATLNVEIIYQTSNRFEKRSSSAQFYERVATALKERDDEFIRFYTSDQGRMLGIAYPDQMVAFRLEDLVLGETSTVQQKETAVRRDSVVVGQMETEANGRQAIYEPVSAEVTTTRIEVTARALLTVVVRDGYTQAVLHRDDLEEIFPWSAEWATHEGDERALTEDQQELCAQPAVAPPAKEELFALVTEPIYDRLHYSVDQFYQDYQ